METVQPTEGSSLMFPSDKLTTTDIFSGVKIREGDNEISRIPCKTIPTVLEEASASVPNRVAYAYKKNPSDSGFEHVTFREYLEQVKTVGKAFLKLGLEKLHSVAIIGFNSPEWILSFLASIYAGGVGCGVYSTNSADATHYCLEVAMSNIAVVEDDKQVQKILQYKDKLPKLKVIVQYSGKPSAQGVISWEELLNIGRGEAETALMEARRKVAVNQCCCIIFTSGTTGFPKGVMISHDNLVWGSNSVLSAYSIGHEDERIVSYLPLSHIAGLMMDVCCHLLRQVTVYFANKDALKGGLLKSLLEVRPTRILGVPRVWEKIAERMKAVGAEAGFLKKHLATWAKSQGLQRNLDLMKGIDSPSLGYLVAKTLIFSKVKAKLGLDCCKTLLTGGAPLATDIKLYFASLDMPIMELFGLSESTGGHTLNVITAFRFDSGGRAMPGAKVKIENPDQDKQGEICLYGRNIFMGYVNNKEATDSTVDANGWLHTGDIGKVDEDGFLYITGRIKELLITAGGENIPPVLIEQNIKTELPFLSQAVLIGDKKKFLSVLLTFSCEQNPDTGEATDELTQLCKNWLKGLGLSFEKLSEVIASGPDKKILEAIQKGIDTANEKAISNAQKVQKFAILPKDFSLPSGEVGPTLKLKRNVINEKYKDVIDKFYES